MKYYTGIGSRSAPDDILLLMEEIGKRLRGVAKLRSGHAVGADQAFERGCNDPSWYELYLPNDNFRGLDQYDEGVYIPILMDNYSKAEEIAEQYHPVWHKLSSKAKPLILRNGYQVLGKDLNTPSDLVICWTPDGATNRTSVKTGGTGQAIRIANDYNIPVINLLNKQLSNIDNIMDLILVHL